MMQYQADLLGVPVERPAVVETTAWGAACLAGLGAGLWHSPQEIAREGAPGRVYYPKTDRAGSIPAGKKPWSGPKRGRRREKTDDSIGAVFEVYYL